MMKGKEKYRKKKVRGNGPEYLRMLLRIVTAGYAVLTAAALPLYFRTETDYLYIGSGKSFFFRKYGLAAAVLFLTVWLVFLLSAAVNLYRRGHANGLQGSCPRGRLFRGGSSRGRLSQGGLFRGRLSVTDGFVAAYILSLCLSFCFSRYRESALWGADGWYMGLLPQMLLAGSYFALSRLSDERTGRWLVRVMLAVSGAVFLLGILNRYGINPLGMEDSGPQYISTIGNINWYCGYWSVLFPLGAGLFLLYEKQQGESSRVFFLKRMALGGFAATGFAAGVTQGSDSGVLALAAMTLLMGWITVGESRRIKRFLEMLLLFFGTTAVLSMIQWLLPGQNTYPTAVNRWITQTPLPWICGACALSLYLLFWKKGWDDACRKIWRIAMTCMSVAAGMTIVSFIILAAANTLYSGGIGPLAGNPLLTLDEEWGSRRGATWTAGVRVWQEQDLLHKMTGVGPDSMSAYLEDAADASVRGMLQEVFGTNRLTNAHNEWLTVLVNLGLSGLISFSGLMVSAVARFIRCRGSLIPPDKNDIIVICCGISLFSYTVNNLFSFQQIMNISQMFLLLGLGEGLLHCRRSA